METSRRSGKASIPIKVEAADFFVDKTFWISVDSKYAKGTIDFVQKGSPDFLNFIEDPNLKLAASVSFSIYGIDRNEDNAISAYEVKYEYPDNQPYGIDAGSYSIKSAKGIEYFPQLKHLDLNMNPDLKELDLSGNPKLASLHLQGCTSLDNLDISKNQELIELGLNYSLFIKISSTGAGSPCSKYRARLSRFTSQPRPAFTNRILPALHRRRM